MSGLRFDFDSRRVRCQNCNYRTRVPMLPQADAVTRKVTIKVQDVIDYYGHSKSEKQRMKQVALSIIARCRIAYGKRREPQHGPKGE